MKLKGFLKQHPLIEQIFKFGIVGTSAFFIDTLVFWVLIKYTHINSYIAIALAFLLSLVYNYILSTRWVFTLKRKGDIGLALVFTLLSIIGLLLTEIIYYFISYMIFIRLMGIRITDLSELFAKVVSSGIVMVYNFVTRKIFLERN